MADREKYEEAKTPLPLSQGEMREHDSKEISKEVRRLIRLAEEGRNQHPDLRESDPEGVLKPFDHH